jgi:Gpi18-like mannosyltransferase
MESGLPQWIWGFANFDGVHYIRTAMWGYVSEYSQVFFPLYPLLMYSLGFLGASFEPRLTFLLSGLVISFLCFVAGIYFYQKVLIVDFSKDIASKTVLFLIAFPTSFYFMTVYTESLFFLLAVLSFYFILKKQFLFASIFIALATATKVQGIFLVLVLILEIGWVLWKERVRMKAIDLGRDIAAVFISGTGLLLYMFYLFINYNNPFYFMTAQVVFGEQRQIGTFILLPQVFYRYLKILLTVPWQSSQFFSASIEVLFALLGGFLLIISFKKIRLSFWLFSLGVFILPTLTGSFYSMPRFLLLLFLTFPALMMFLKDKWKYVVVLSFCIQLIFTFLFVGGYWIS